MRQEVTLLCCLVPLLTAQQPPLPLPAVTASLHRSLQQSLPSTLHHAPVSDFLASETVAAVEAGMKQVFNDMETETDKRTATDRGNSSQTEWDRIYFCSIEVHGWMFSAISADASLHRFGNGSRRPAGLDRGGAGCLAHCAGPRHEGGLHSPGQPAGRPCSSSQPPARLPGSEHSALSRRSNKTNNCAQESEDILDGSLPMRYIDETFENWGSTLLANVTVRTFFPRTVRGIQAVVRLAARKVKHKTSS